MVKVVKLSVKKYNKVTQLINHQLNTINYYFEHDLSTAYLNTECLQTVGVLYYLCAGKDPKLPSTGIVPQRSLLETSLHNHNDGLKLVDNDKSIN